MTLRPPARYAQAAFSKKEGERNRLSRIDSCAILKATSIKAESRGKTRAETNPCGRASGVPVGFVRNGRAA